MYLWYPQIAKYPPGVTGWLSASGIAWALGDDGMIYRNGVEPLNPASGADSWSYLRGQYSIDNLGRLYYLGLLRGPEAQAADPWVEVAASLSITSEGELYQFDGLTLNLIPLRNGATSWKAIDASTRHYIILDDNGEIYTWGFNYSGQLGFGDRVSRNTPTLLPRPAGVSGWTAIAAGDHHTLAVADTGELYAWGRNWEGQLGLGSLPLQIVLGPTAVPFPEGVQRWMILAASSFHSMAIGDDCRLYTWGENGFGQLGMGPNTGRVEFPTLVPGVDQLCGTPVLVASESRRLPNGDFLVEFRSQLNRTYTIEYSADAADWLPAIPPVLGTGDLVQWIDDGPPKTISSPSEEVTRFYRIVSGR